MKLKHRLKKFVKKSVLTFLLCYCVISRTFFHQASARNFKNDFNHSAHSESRLIESKFLPVENNFCEMNQQIKNFQKQQQLGDEDDNNSTKIKNKPSSKSKQVSSISDLKSKFNSDSQNFKTFKVIINPYENFKKEALITKLQQLTSGTKSLTETILREELKEFGKLDIQIWKNNSRFKETLSNSSESNDLSKDFFQSNLKTRKWKKRTGSILDFQKEFPKEKGEYVKLEVSIGRPQSSIANPSRITPKPSNLGNSVKEEKQKSKSSKSQVKYFKDLIQEQELDD